MRKFAITLALLALTVSLPAEIIYMNDGQVIRGTIVSEGTDTITVRTEYQTRTIFRRHVTRIMYGERDMEPIYFLMRDGRLINGFLVDQDSRKVVYRKTKDSPEEFTLLKEDISQMSAKEITPLYPDLTFRGGIYYPVNPGGSKLSPSAIYFGGYGINFTWVKNARLLLEAGYTKCASEASDNLKFQVIPFVLSGLYSLPFPFTGDDLGKKLRLVPKAGAGLAVVDFDDGEGSQYRGYDFTALAGAGIVYELSRKTLSAGVWMEYNLIYEKSSMMHGALLSAGLQFMF